MNVIQVCGARSWNYKVPQVVRYMEVKWIEHFFETGELLLTTFNRCRYHEDIARRDEDEGVARFNLENGSTTLGGNIRTGSTSYMLCGSLVESERLMEKFSTDGCFLINDPVQFADAIARWLPGFVEGYVGPCIYRKDRRIRRMVDQELAPDMSSLLERPKVEPSQDELNKVMDQLNQSVARNIHNSLGFDSFLCKDVSFSDEAEFRFVWSMSEEVVEPFVVRCPDAIKFCSTNIPIMNPYRPKRPVGEPGIFCLGSSKPYDECADGGIAPDEGK